MNKSLNAGQVEMFLSRAYGRIQRITVALSVLGAILATMIFGWRSGLGLAIGAVVGYINFVWLHNASAMMTDRMVSPGGGKGASKLPVMLAFGGRYIFVIAAAYVIFKSTPKLIAGFAVALFFPIVAATCEGIYEAFASNSTDET